MEKLFSHYPVVTVTGPRQSGKTTLCRSTFPDKPYVALDTLDMKEYASTDPRGLLEEYPDAIIDEVQHAPDLLGYIKQEVDRKPDPGRFVLTGSQHFDLMAKVTESLAGRTGVLHLLPLSLDEIQRFEGPHRDLFETMLTGGYPRIHDTGIPPARWLGDYVTTYIQRDVRQLLSVTDLEAFTTFVRLCAGRTAQEVNLSSLGSDAGISHNTARSWLSVLETSYICTRIPAWLRSTRKQLVKAPKLHFLDSGLLCRLLRIDDAAQLRHHPLRGAIFESWVASEILKNRLNAGRDPDLHHYRQTRGAEIDLVIASGTRLTLIEMKSGATASSSHIKPLEDFASHLPRNLSIQPYLVYGGTTPQRRSTVTLLPWSSVADETW